MTIEISGNMLKEAGRTGRNLFMLSEQPGLGKDAEKIRAKIVAACNAHDELAAALKVIADFAARSSDDYADTKELTSTAGHTCMTIRVPVALLNRIRDAAELIKAKA